MIRSLIQYADDAGRGVAALDAQGDAHQLVGVSSIRDLALDAIERRKTLLERANALRGSRISLQGVRLLAPIDHPDPAHLLISGTGLTHLGSAEGRDKMHKAAAAGHATDSMRMFLMGEEGGKPGDGQEGVQPEWFYKGDGSILVSPGAPLAMPHFAGDGGEEPEIAGIYLNGPDGTPFRLGFALGNEFSDHVTERVNYLWLAHSKLRQAALGPNCCWATCLPMFVASAASCEMAKPCGNGRSCLVNATCRTASTILNITISNMRSSGGPATCMCISSVQPPSPSPTRCRRRSETCSKWLPTVSACRSAILWSGQRTKGLQG